MISQIKWRKLEYLMASGISVTALLVYIVTLCPTVNFIDSGELATVTHTLGIAHPTGYPFFTIVGWLWSHIPFGFRTIYQLNLMAALFCAAGLFFFFRFFVFLLGEFTTSTGKMSAIRPDMVSSKALYQVFLPSAFATLILGFSETYWSQALSIEVYSLHLFFLSIIIFLFVKAITIELNRREKIGQERNAEPYWLGFAFVLGLSFTNHMTTILLAPAFLYLYFYVHRFSSTAWKRILKLTVPFLLGFSVYLYLPIRALQMPPLNWGNPIDLERFIWHFSGKVYRVWIFSSTDSAAKQFKYFLDTLPSEFAYFPIAISLLGIIALFKQSKPLFVFTVLLFLGCLLYSINYDINDIDSYFLLAYIMVALWAAFGMHRIIGLVRDGKFARILSVACIVSSVVLIVMNYNQVDQSDNHIVEDYTHDMFESIQPNGIIISAQWDYFISASYYLQIVEHVRPDVIVIDKELMRRSWYYPQLQRQYPALTAQSRKEIDALMIELNKFEHNTPYNPSMIEFRYASVIRSFIEKNYRTRPVYVTSEIGREYTAGYNLAPVGLALRVYPDSLRHESPNIHFDYRIPRRRDKYVEGILSMYANALLNNAVSSSMFRKRKEALAFLDEALAIQPGFREAIELKGRLSVER